MIVTVAVAVESEGGSESEGSSAHRPGHRPALPQLPHRVHQPKAPLNSGFRLPMPRSDSPRSSVASASHSHPAAQTLLPAPPHQATGDDETESETESDAEANMQATTLRSFVREIRDASVGAIKKIPAAMLFGEPGVGKSRWVSKLAELLGLYLCRVSLDKTLEWEPASNIMFGSMERRTNPVWSISREDTHRGLIASCAIKAGSLNFILFMDEVDTTLTSKDYSIRTEWERLFRDLLEDFPAKKAYALEGLGGVKMDISRITFITASNRELVDSALRNRMQTFVFPPKTAEQRMAIYQKAIDEELIDLHKHKPRWPAAWIDLINSTMAEILPSIVAIDVQSFAGVRAGLAITNDVVKEAIGQVEEQQQKHRNQYLFEHQHLHKHPHSHPIPTMIPNSRPMKLSSKKLMAFAKAKLKLRAPKTKSAQNQDSDEE